MSLINRMLNDLDDRRAAGSDAVRAHSDVRPLPVRRKAVLPWVLAANALLVGLAATSWWWLRQGPGRALPELPAAVSAQAVNANLPPLLLSAEALPSVPGNASVDAVATAPSPAANGRFEAPGKAAFTAAIPMPDLKLSAQLSRRVATRPDPLRPASGGEPAMPVPPASVPALNPLPATTDAPGAIEKLALQTSPQEKAERLYRAALNLFAQSRPDDGLTTLRGALREDPKHVAARQLLLKNYIDSRSYDAAQGVLQDGLAQWPQQTAWALLLSRLQADRSDNEGALRTLEKAAGHATQSADYHAALGAVLQRLGRHAEAALHYEQSTRIDAANGRWWLGLGLANELQGKPAEARNAFQRAAAARNLSVELQAFVEQKLN